MSKIRSLISALLGLLALAVLAVGLTWFLGPRGPRPGQQVLVTRQVSPLPTPTPGLMETPTPTRYVEPTAPSEDWPTLTPPPTRVMPTPGTPVVKDTQLSTPTATRPPLPLAPLQEGLPPTNLPALYYRATSDKTSELRVISIDLHGRRWPESKMSLDIDESLDWLYLSPDGKYLAINGGHIGRTVTIVEIASGRAWCPLGERSNCIGNFVSWMRNGRFLFCAEMDNTLDDVTMGSKLIVDVSAGQYTQLDLPVSPYGAYSDAHYVSLSPDESRIAYVKGNSEIWTMQIDGKDKRLLQKVEGVVHALTWSPSDEQLIYSYQPGTMPASNASSELWVMNSDGSNAKLLANNHGTCYPVWSPAGRLVAFAKVDDPTLFDGDWRGPGANMYVVDAATGELTRLSAFADHSISSPIWSPDGHFVAFVSSIITKDPQSDVPPPPTYTDIWLASADGSQLYALAQNVQWNTSLIWLPTQVSIPEKSR